MSDIWYYADQGKQAGPFSIAQLKAALLKIPNAKDVFVWRHGFTDWQRAGAVAELVAETSASPPPFAGQAVPIAPTGAANPAAQPNVVHLWFSFSGRINRAKYWLVSLINLVILVIAIGAGFVASLGAAFMVSASPAWILVGLIILAVMVSSYAVAAKRLHDRDKSAWWILIYYVIPGIISVGGRIGGEGMVIFTGLISMLFYIAAFVDLGCLRGTVGDNRFGPDPLAGQQ